MKYARDITGLVGHTPLVRLNKVVDTGGNLVLAKLEQFNPCGSLKDRAALSMVDEAEQSGKLKPGGMIVEATSGNTGIALAFIAAARGYSLVVVMPDSMSVERQKLIGLFGGTVVLTPAHLGMQGSIDRAQKLIKESNNAFLVGQFDNPANPLAHEEHTAEEIFADTDGKVDVVVAGVGTGGTITGIAKRLKQRRPSVKIVAVEPAGSAVLSGREPGPHMIQGIGAGFVPEIMDVDLVDHIVPVSDEEALGWAKKLVTKEGILAGISSGAAACATHKFLARHKPDRATVVAVFPDTGERYLTLSAFAGRR